MTADIVEVLPSIGDRYLLCSDGLCGEVPDEQTAAVLRRLARPDEAARELVRLALVGGGSDNISVIVVDVVDDGDAALNASAMLAADGDASTRSARPEENASDAPVRRRGRLKRERSQPRQPRPPRQARLVTWRTMLFMLLLSGLGVIAVLVIRNAPTDEASTSTTVVVATTAADPFAPADSLPTSAVTTSAVTTIPTGSTTIAITVPAVP